MVQVIKIGDPGSLVFNAYLAEAMAVARRTAISHVAEYQHKSAGADTVPFMAVYSQDPEVSAAARHEINWNPAITPEMTLSWFRYDKIIVVDDTNPQHLPGERIITGLVIIRSIDNHVARVRVVVSQQFADNGNMYWQDHSVSRLPAYDTVIYDLPAEQAEQVMLHALRSTEGFVDNEAADALEEGKRLLTPAQQ